MKEENKEFSPFLPLHKFCKRTTADQILKDVDLNGKTFLIIGATSGIGSETAKVLALNGATVVITGTNLVKAVDLVEEVKCIKPEAQITFSLLDLADLQSVAEFANKFLSLHEFLHCLVLNAAVYNPTHRITDNEFESTFQINYLSQFYLAKLLLPAMQRASPSRLIVVTCRGPWSIGGKLPMTKIHWDHLSPTHKPNYDSALYAYNLSKKCLRLFSLEFNRKYETQGITSYAVDPGFCPSTNLYRNSRILSCWHNFKQIFLRQNKAQSAAQIVLCAVANSSVDSLLQGGQTMKNFKALTVSKRKELTNDKKAELLWSHSEFMIDVYLGQLERTLKKKFAS